MKNTPDIILEHILESILLCEEYTKGLSQDDFLKNHQLQDAVVRRIEIIGEASRQLPNVIKENAPTIPWKQIIGTRDICIHGYFQLNLKMIWEIMNVSLPPLKIEVERLLERQKFL